MSPLRPRGSAPVNRIDSPPLRSRSALLRSGLEDGQSPPGRQQDLFPLYEQPFVSTSRFFSTGSVPYASQSTNYSICWCHDSITLKSESQIPLTDAFFSLFYSFQGSFREKEVLDLLVPWSPKLVTALEQFSLSLKLRSSTFRPSPSAFPPPGVLLSWAPKSKRRDFFLLLPDTLFSSHPLF